MVNEKAVTDGALRSFLFSASRLVLQRQYDHHDGTQKRRLQFFGTAALGSDRIAIAGQPKHARKQLLFIAETSTSSRSPWSVSLGYNASDPVIGLPEEWYLHCFLPDDIFDALHRDYLERRTDSIEGACLTDIPVDSAESKAISPGVTWLLEPGEYFSARGAASLTMFRWNVRPK